MKITEGFVALLGFLSIAIGGGILWGFGITLLWVGIIMLVWAFFWNIGL